MSEHYETVTYWYGLPAASLVQTDELNIGDAASEHEHGYHSPDATAPQAGLGRHTRGSSEFTLNIRPDNRGVMLRRTLDYDMANQKAAVS